MYYNNPNAKLVNYKARRTFQMIYIIGMIYFMWQYPIGESYFGIIGAFVTIIIGQIIDAVLMYNKNKGDERRERAWKQQTIKETKYLLLMVAAMIIPLLLIVK